MQSNPDERLCVRPAKQREYEKSRVSHLNAENYHKARSTLVLRHNNCCDRLWSRRNSCLSRSVARRRLFFQYEYLGGGGWARFGEATHSRSSCGAMTLSCVLVCESSGGVSPSLSPPPPDSLVPLPWIHTRPKSPVQAHQGTLLTASSISIEKSLSNTFAVQGCHKFLCDFVDLISSCASEAQMPAMCTHLPAPHAERKICNGKRIGNAAAKICVRPCMIAGKRRCN